MARHAIVVQGHALPPHQLNETTLFATLKFHCQSLSSLKDWL